MVGMVNQAVPGRPEQNNYMLLTCLSAGDQGLLNGILNLSKGGIYMDTHTHSAGLTLVLA